MRDIVFRAKVKKPVRPTLGEILPDGTWVYGELHATARVPHIHETPCSSQPIDTETIGQYTGLTDKNGKKIFEGDIVAFTFYSDLAEHARLEERPEITENHVILFHDGSFWMNRIVVPDSLTAQLYGRRVVLESLWKHRVEVIGNIHDNPDLLNRVMK